MRIGAFESGSIRAAEIAIESPRALGSIFSRAVRGLPTQEKPSSESAAQIELKPVTVSTPTLSHRMRKSADTLKDRAWLFQKAECD